MNKPDEALGQAEALLLEAYGLRLLAFLCGAESDDAMLEFLQGRRKLHEETEAVVREALLPLAQSVARQTVDRPGLPRALALRGLSETSADGITSLGSAIRRAAGGTASDDLPEVDNDDEVKSALGRLAVAAYPVLLAPRESLFPPPFLSLFRHPDRVRLQAALRRDPSLAKIFTAEEPGIGRIGSIYTSLGRGGGVQDVMFGEQMIVSAWDRLVLTRPRPDLEDLVGQLHKNVDDLRRVADGGRIAVPAHLIFTGFTTAAGCVIDTPWGVLRPIETWERSLAPAGLEGAVSSTSASGETTTVAYSGEMVLETRIPYSITIGVAGAGLSDAPAEWPSSGLSDFRRKLEGVQLALILTVEGPPDEWVGAQMAWTWTADLYNQGVNLSWSDARSSARWTPRELTAEECMAAGKWAMLIEKCWTPRIDISVRRLIGAASHRTDMADRLVDSVIVWENLFGTSQGETRLRISSSMAWLLARGECEREALQVKLRKIYDDRSKIVHGGKPNEATLGEQANAALIYSRDALRVLLRDRPDVLALVDGAARSTRMMLGG